MDLKALRSMGIALIACIVFVWLPLWYVLSRGPSQQEQIETLRVGIAEYKAQNEADRRAFDSKVQGLMKEIKDLQKNLGVQKTLLIQAKGRSLNADQDIQKMVDAAVRAEPIRPIHGEAELMERARNAGLKSVVLR
ncbi:MAG: hypothetical protein OEW25_02730 [Nitrospira sp.]|nr:hypothetical protein [Nitrospira sp.]